jgi:signal-transduction protein with cAMP-binding, CBS, and nucleotidyltransferase domain
MMSLSLQWVPATATVAEAAGIMRDRSMGFLLVAGTEPGELVGVVTDRDIAVRCCAANLRPDETLVVEIATKPVVTCDHNENLKTAEMRMIEAEISRLVIVDEIGCAVGVLSLTDILYHDRALRAVRTARGILAREADGAHPPLASIQLTPSTPEEEERAARQGSGLHGGSWDQTVKLFP